MLLATIFLWALSLSATRYLLTHGFEPLAYTAVRYACAALTFAAISLALEGTLRVSLRHVSLLVAAAAALYLNQLAFVYAVKTTSASVIALILGVGPIFAGSLGMVLRTERLPRRFWIGAAVSVGGVGLVALGSGGEVHGDLGGVLLGVLTAATWAGYSVAIRPLVRTYSPARKIGRAHV